MSVSTSVTNLRTGQPELGGRQRHDRHREQEELGAVRPERDRIFLTRQVHAIDEFFAEDIFALLGEPDDRKIVQAEIVRGGERNAELAAAAVDHEEIGKLPVRIVRLRRRFGE